MPTLNQTYVKQAKKIPTINPNASVILEKAANLLKYEANPYDANTTLKITKHKTVVSKPCMKGNIISRG